MSLNGLMVNQSIKIQIDKGNCEGTYSSKILEINDKNMAIDFPCKNGNLLSLEKNLPVTIFFVGDNAAYKFHSSILELFKDISVLTIKKPVEFIRLQRRNYFRLDVDVTVKFQYKQPEEDESFTDSLKKTKTIDISGGGVKLILDENIPCGTIVKLFLHIPEIYGVPILGKIVHTQKMDDNKYTAGIKFVELDSDIKNKIIKWLFDCQRNLL